MQATPLQTRQILGCGYESPVVQIRGLKRQPYKPAEYQGDDPEFCVGYTTNLPEVVEASRARFWLKERDLRSFTRDEPTDQTALAIEVLEIEARRVGEAVMKRPKGSG